MFGKLGTKLTKRAWVDIFLIITVIIIIIIIISIIVIVFVSCAIRLLLYFYVVPFYYVARGRVSLTILQVCAVYYLYLHNMFEQEMSDDDNKKKYIYKLFMDIVMWPQPDSIIFLKVNSREVYTAVYIYL